LHLHSVIFCVSLVSCSLGFSAASPGQIPPDLEDLQDELKRTLEEVNFTSLTAGLINLGTTRDARATSLKVDRDPGEGSIATEDPREFNLSRLYLNLYRPLGKNGKAVRIGVYFGKAKTDEDFQLNRVLQYTGSLQTKSKNVGFDVALKVPMSNSKWSLEPGLGFGYTKFSFDHDYVGDVGENIIKPIAEGIFFNWQSKVFSYRGLLSAKYQLPFGNQKVFRFTGTYVHSFINSYKSTDPVQNINSHFDTLFARVQLDGPTRMELFKRPLGWRLTVSHTHFVGKNDIALGFRWYNRYAADLVWNYSGQIKVLDEVSLGVGVLSGKGVQGFSVGLGIKIKI
jgi:hypothetical protein